MTVQSNLSIALDAYIQANFNGTLAQISASKLNLERLLQIQRSLLSVSPRIVRSAPIALSGTAINITGLTSNLKSIDIAIEEATNNGSATSHILRIGDSNGISSSNYSSIETYIGVFTGGNEASNEFLVAGNMDSTKLFTGFLRLTNIGSNSWMLAGQGFFVGTSYSLLLTGAKELSLPLDRIQLTTVAGTNSFLSGTMQLTYTYE